MYLAHISHIPNFHYLFRNEIGTPANPFGVILLMFSKSLRPSWFISHVSRAYLAHISHIPNFHYLFQNEIGTPVNPFGVILLMFVKSLRPSWFISHVSRTFQTFTIYFNFHHAVMTCLVSLLCNYYFICSFLFRLQL